MALQERLSNLGYLAVAKESTAGTAVTPNIFIPVYKNTLATALNLVKDNPVMGVNSAVYKAYMGLRKHTGQIETSSDPNTIEYFWDMLLANGGITGGGDPYTHLYTEGLSNSYTIDTLKGQLVERHWGVRASSVESNWDKNLLRLVWDVAGQGSLYSRQLATVNTTTITLDTSYDPAPNKGFVASDLVRIMKADGSTTLDTTISSVNGDGITLVLGASAAAYSAGDYIFLRAQTPSYTLDANRGLFARTEFRFASTLASALTATHTPQETSVKWKITNAFNKPGGEERSGSFDAPSIPRLQTSADIDLEMFFDQPQMLQLFLNVATDALVIRHFIGSNHELRLSFDALNFETSDKPLEAAKLIYHKMKAFATYSTGGAEAFKVQVLNALSS